MFRRDILLYMNLYRAKKKCLGETFYSYMNLCRAKKITSVKNFHAIFFCFCFNGTANNFIFTAVAQGFQNCAWI